MADLYPAAFFLLPAISVSTDGGFYVDIIDVLPKTYGRALTMDGQKPQSFQSIARAGWPRFSLAVFIESAVLQWPAT
ncbi:MAG TPA: hypothetical protein VNE82_03575 [Candidatus Binataceae bacterium]|nr:hypothetical protein [Candidatus Binataceae bacterium]